MWSKIIEASARCGILTRRTDASLMKSRKEWKLTLRSHHRRSHHHLHRSRRHGHCGRSRLSSLRRRRRGIRNLHRKTSYCRVLLWT